MPGLSAIALGSAPLFGGALLGIAAGKLQAPDLRGILIKDLDLLDRIPPDQSARRAEVQRVVNMHIDDLVTAADRSRAVRVAASSYRGNWRDIVLFVCMVLFAIIWWNVDHDRTNWLTMFVALILLSGVAAAYALRGVYSSLRTLLRRSSKLSVTR